eukprot:3850452-Rhodomonas_salina.2
MAYKSNFPGSPIRSMSVLNARSTVPHRQQHTLSHYSRSRASGLRPRVSGRGPRVSGLGSREGLGFRG